MDMATFYGTEVAQPLDVVAEELVMQEEVGAEVELNEDMDNVASQSAIDMLSKSRRELCYPEDSSEDEGDTTGSRLYVSSPNAIQGKGNDAWTQGMKDDCLCWECGERFKTLELLMRHFRMHEAQVCCNLCHVTFRRVVSLSMHLNNVHNNVVLFCTTCRLPFDSKWDLNEHLGKHSDLSDPPILVTVPSQKPEEEEEKCPALSEPVVQQGGSVEKQVLHKTPVQDLKPVNEKLSPESLNFLPGVVAKDHAYNNRTASRGNGKVSTTYALRVRHTKTLTKVFPRDSLPESARQKKIQFFVFRNVDRRPEKEAKGGERGGEQGEEAEKDDAEPDETSWNAPLPDSMASPDSSSWIKQEGVDPDIEAAPWEGEPIEEDEEAEGDEGDEEESDHPGEASDHPEDDEQSDSLPAEDSDYDPGEVSDDSSESVSSGNSSGSSYSPHKHWRKRTRTRVVTGTRMLSRAGSSQQPAVPIQVSLGGKTSSCPHCGKEQVNLSQHIQICEKQKVSTTHFPGKTSAEDRKVMTYVSVKPSRMYACDICREVFPEQVTYRRHHCPMKTLVETTSATFSSTSTPTPGTITLATSVQAPAMAVTPLATPPSAITLSPSSTLLANSTPTSDSSGGVMKVAQMAVPCPVQNTTVVPPLSVTSGTSFSLPGIMLSSSSPPSQSGPRPIMATVVINGSNSSGRVTRVVLQSQGLTFPTQTISQTQPVRLSVPAGAKTLTTSQLPPSMQLTNLVMGGIIQPQALIRSQLLSAVPPGPAPAPAPVPTPVPASAPAPACTVSPALIPTTAPTPVQTTTPTSEPLKILGLFVNRSQELALQQRLNKSWRSKSVFLCRQCGAISRQPSLGVRHRYLHRGSRQHRCHCGRTFQHQLHLLRHHVQHAEATRFVCAPCGETFAGAHCLARHKQGQEGKRKKRKKLRPRKDCLAPFSCDCGQLFQRPTAFLWHKLKNPKKRKNI